MSHESFTRWFALPKRPLPSLELSHAAIAWPETFTGAEAWYSRAVATTSQAGGSPAAASRVTGSARVLPETRREVEEAIARLGYVRNRAPCSVDRLDRVRRLRTTRASFPNHSSR